MMIYLQNNSQLFEKIQGGEHLLYNKRVCLCKKPKSMQEKVGLPFSKYFVAYF